MKEIILDRKAAEARRCSENMRRLLASYRSMLEDALREKGLTLAQLRLLKAIREKSDVSAAALARTCMVTPQTLQAVLGRAVREGWIERGVSSRNRRFVTASLTLLGHSVLEIGLRMAVRTEERLWRGVKLGELQRLNKTLARGVANLEEDIQQSRVH